MLEDYKKERKKGLKEVKDRQQEGKDPFLPVFNVETTNKQHIGVTSILLDMITGTTSEARSNSFSYSFHPLQEEISEFSHKWVHLYDTQVEVGIDDPIQVYEYKHQFYVQEGNKRVSVFKALHARSIEADVTRILSIDKDETLQAFYDFYLKCPVYDISFSSAEYYKELLDLTNHLENEIWNEEDVRALRSRYRYFYSVYSKINHHETMNVSDAFLMYIRIYSYQSLLKADEETLKERIHSIYQEVSLLYEEHKQIYRTSSEDNHLTLSIKRKYYTHINPLKIAFVYENYPNMKEWDLDHEMGRLYVQNIFGDKVQTQAFSKQEISNIQGYDLVFSTSVFLMENTIKEAIKHPNTTYLNCSIETPSKAVSSYYGRMYEIKFLMGVLAGLLTKKEYIGYIKDETTHPSEINAFACGVSMIHPDTKIICTTNMNEEAFDVFVGYDLPNDADHPIFGLCKKENDEIINMATPIHHWGKYYEIMIRHFIQGTLFKDTYTRSHKALQDIWGMDSDVIDLLLSQRIPVQTRTLIESLKKNILHNELNLFVGMYESMPSLEEILKMKEYHPNIIESNK